MEKTADLKQYDDDLCEYFEQYTDPKKSSIFCYAPDKKQISDFYNRMSDHFFTQKIVRP